MTLHIHWHPKKGCSLIDKDRAVIPPDDRGAEHSL